MKPDWTVADSTAITGFVADPYELQWLHDRAKGMRSIVEIGCWKGQSASALAAGTDGTVYTVDTFEGSPSEWETNHMEAKLGFLYDEACANLAPYGNVEVLKMSSLHASRLLPSVDMVWIDAEHTRESCLIDLMLWYPKCTTLLCGHDVGFDGVIAALGLYGIPFQLGPGSIWYMEKRRAGT